MTKSELIAALSAEHPHLRAADVETIVGTIFDEITLALSRGERVELRGFGAFTIKHRNARTGRNPRTGEQAYMPPTRRVKFVPSRRMKFRVRSSMVYFPKEDLVNKYLPGDHVRYTPKTHG